MSLENEDPLLERSSRKTKVCYTRDELLSFSKLSNKLPNGFDASVLSNELDEASYTVNERQRGFGGLSFQSSKRSDYTSPPPNRSEVAVSYSHGSSGRWDGRLNNRDGDLQSNRETNTQDIGRRFGTQSRRYAQHAEHDGLLGSGAFPRPSGGGGSSTAKSRATSQFPLNKTSEPYQPPRPYKALPFQRKDDRDSCNDETFGSTDYSNEDRAEEQRRRESFELMRREQRKSLQEKQNNHKLLDADIITLLENSADKKSIISKTDKADDSSISKIESPRSSTMHAPLSRPLVPPGFASTAVDKILPVQSNCLASEASIDGAVNNKHLDSIHSDKEKRQQLDVGFNDSVRKHEIESLSSTASDLRNVNEVQVEVVTNDVLDKKKGKFDGTNSLVDNSSVSILEKLLGGSLHISGTSSTSSTSSSNQGLKKDEEPWTSSVSVSSKFASWFLEEENKPSEDFSSKNLLSLIVNNDKVGSSESIVSHGKVFEHEELDSTDISNTTQKFHVSPTTTLAIGVSTQYHEVDKLDSSPAVLTCEDLEQSILADVKGGPSLQHMMVQGPETRTDEKMELRKSDIDEHASQHLLSLLQKGTKKEEMTTGTGLDVEFFYKSSSTDKNSSLDFPTPEKSSTETMSSADKTVTLEALFGAAFMNELQSAQAPVSTQRVPDGGTNTNAFPSSAGLPFPTPDASFFSSSSSDYQPNKSGHQNDAVPLGTVGSGEKILDFHLPDEQSLIIDSDALESATSDPIPFASAGKEELFSKMNAERLNNNLLSANPRSAEDIQNLGSFQSPHDLVNAGAFHHPSQGRASSHPAHHAMPPHPLLDHLTHGNQQMKHITPEQNFHDPQNFLENLVPHNAYHANAPHLDPTSYHLMLQQLSIPGNFLQQLPHPGFPRVMQLPHQINRVQGFVPETNNMHNIALQHQQSNYGSFGMGMPGAFVGGSSSNHPDAFQRLLEMEMIANEKHAHPAAAGQIPRMYGPEYDMSFQYR